MMGETLAQTICDNKTPYKPGMWFNSAKFFDIEYQTYGWVNSELKDNETDFYWEHEKGEKCLHLVYDQSTNKLTGINTFGIRMRHEVCERWISGKKDMNYIIEHLKDANFDPEFYKQYETDILSAYNSEFGTAITPQKKSWKRIFSKA